MRRLLLTAAVLFSIACGEDRDIPPAQQGVDASVLDAGAADAGPWKVCVLTCYDTGQAVSCLYSMGACASDGAGPNGCNYGTARYDGSGAGESPTCR